MKIQNNVIIIFLLCFSLLFVTTFFFVNEEAKNTMIQSETLKMKSILLEKEFEIDSLNEHAKEDMIFAMKNPLFVEYFELPETKEGNKFQNGVMQFTERQNEIKSKLERWIYHFQNKFQVDETCIIDLTGQEHARLVLKNIAPDVDLSSEEASAPFFEPSFKINKDDAHIQYPYISPDTNRWVFAYTSPIVLGDNEKPAFYHFEMPISIFQNIIKPELGRMYVIDSEGILIADSQHDFNAKANDLENYFPTIETISDSRDFKNIVEKMKINDSGTMSFKDGENTHHIVFTHLSIFDWILVYDLDENTILSNESVIDSLKNNIIILFSIIGLISITGFYFATKQISKPLDKIIIACNNINPERLSPINIEVSDEFHGIKNSINSMIKKIFIHEEKNIEYQEEIASQNEEIVSQNEEIVSQNEEIEFKNKELTKELNKNIETERKKDEFLSMMTHEFKTPLTPIISWADMLLSKAFGNITEKQESGLLKIKSNSMKLLGLITDVLDAHKIDLNQMTFNKSRTNSKEIAMNFANNYEIVMEKNRIEFIFSDIDNIPLYTDKNRIDQVLRIFVTNAIDFVPDENPKIEIKVKKESDFVSFYIIDNGAGIPKENQDKLFNKFYQIDSAVTRKHGGSGLGLAVAKGIAEGLNGKVGINSEYRHGSMFFIKIPINNINSTTKT